MEAFFWVVVITIALAFCFRVVYYMGFNAGAKKILAEWKQFLNEL